MISFSKFPEPNLNFFNRKGEVMFKYDLGDIRSKRIEQYVYAYFVTPSSISGTSFTVRGSSIGNFPTIYEKKLGVGNVAWKFSRTVLGEIDLVLAYFAGSGVVFHAEVVSDFKAKREDIVKVLKPLASTARNFGMPKDGNPIVYIHTDDKAKEKDDKIKDKNLLTVERYFKVLGLIPTSNIGLIRAAYRELAKQYHPDRSGGITQERMKEINEAYEQVIFRLNSNRGA